MSRAGNDAGNELSDFEKQRQANIAERDALLKKLTAEAQSDGLFTQPLPTRALGNNAKPPKKKTRAKKIKEEEAPAPRRVSSRLRGIAAESETAKRKAAEEHEAVQQDERAKRVRKSDSFTYDDMVVWGQKLSGDSLIGVDVVTKGVAKPYGRTFGDADVSETTDKDLKSLREEMSGLRLWDAWEPNRIKITPERIYCMAFHPSESKPLVFAGDKMGHLGVLDASQEKQVSGVKNEDDEDADDPDPNITTLKPHARTISSMLIHPLKPTHLYTASYDSSVREMDLEKSTSVEKLAPSSTSMDEPTSSIDMAADDPNLLHWATLDGAFGRYDMRTSRDTAVHWQLCDKKIGGFSLHPSRPHYIATASLDRTMKLWDLRKLSHDDPTPVGEHESRLSVSHAAFNSAGQIVTSSYDDSLKIYDFGSKGIASWDPGHTLSEKDMRPHTIVRHNCQTGRWVTILRPQWQLNPQSHIQRFCIANMNRFVDIYSGTGDQLAQLGGDGVTAVPAVAVFHRSKNWVVGGTASGKVCLWK